MLETEAEVVHRLAQHSRRGPLGIEIGITVGKGREYLCGPPPATLAVLGFAEGLIDNIHQVNRALIGHVLLNQRLYLVVL